MRSQASLAEALLASLILATSCVVIANIAYSISLSYGTGTINMQNAEFDLQNLIYSNTTMGLCVRTMNTSCTSGLMRAIDNDYGLSYSIVEVGNTSMAEGNSRSCKNNDHYCFPLKGSDATYTQVCEYLCSG